MKKITFLLVVCFIIFQGCGKDGGNGAVNDKKETAEKQENYIDQIVFEQSVYTLKEDESTTAKLFTVDNLKVRKAYDLQVNPLGITFRSDNEEIASIDDHGVLKALQGGTVKVQATSSDGKLKASTEIRVIIDKTSTTGITKPLTEDLIYSKKGQLRTMSAVMQSFDVDSQGEIYYSQLNRNYRAYLSHGRPNSKYSEVMTLNYFGHVSNFTVEEDGNDRYIWIDNFSSKNSKGEYWGSPIVSRVKFVGGRTLNSWEATDNYYCGVTNISVAVDIDNDMMTILGITTGEVITYRLSDAQKLPRETVKIRIVYGGESNNDSDKTEQTREVDVLARDLRKLTPLGKFVSNRIGDVPWQGFDINNGKFYQAEGSGNNNDGKSSSTAFLTVRDIHGNIIEERTRVAAIEDIDALRTMDITNTGYMEAEGVKIRSGKMYLGYASKNSADERTGTILMYNPSSKRVK